MTSTIQHAIAPSRPAGSLPERNSGHEPAAEARFAADTAARVRTVVAATALIGFGAAVLVAWLARGESLGVIAAGAIAAGVGGVAILATRWAGAGALAAGEHTRGIDADLASSPGAVTDADGAVIVANQAFWRSFARVPVERILDLAALAVDKAAARTLLEDQLRPDEALVTSTLMPVRSGDRERYFRVRVRREDAGRRLLWTFDDVSEEYAAAERARSEAARYRVLLDRLPVGACQVDAAGMLRFANAQFAALVGLAADEVAAGRVRWSDLAIELIPAPEPNQAGQLSLKDNAGELHRAAWFEAPAGEGESSGGIVGILVPRPKGDGPQQALGDVAQRFSEAIRRAPIGIALLDPGGAIAYANPAFGRIAFPDGTEPAPERKVRGRPLGAFVADADRAATETQLSLAVTARQPADAIDVAWKSKHTVIVSIIFTPMAGDDGSIDCVLATVVNITTQRQLEQQFTQAQKMQAVGQLAGGVAHDFNNLLTAMIGFCDLLLGRLAPGDQSYEDVHQIQQNANRAANLVRQLLAFSRKQTMTPRVVSLTDTVAELGHMLRRLLGEGIDLNIVYARNLWQVKVDESQLQHVIINLAVNARDAMRGRGTLTIETGNFPVTSTEDSVHEAMPPGDYVCIKVVDTGVGIEKQIIDRIWEPFFTTKEMGAGTGLGLSTCYGIVKQTGGFIFAESEVGKGSTFGVYLPRHIPVDGQETVKEFVPRKARDLTGAGRVLLVEDEDAVRLFSTRALKNKGYEVLAANGGEQALELLDEAENKIDLLITDVMMPEMDGPTLIKAVRERIPDIKAVCISGYAEDTIRDRLADDTDIHFLAKPFNLEDLATMVKEVLSE